MADENSALSSRLGLYYQPGQGEAWPELAAQVLDLYRSRVARLPFVPIGWIAQVEAAAAGSRLLIPTGPLFASLAYPIPGWIASDQAAKEAWQQVNQLIRDAVSKYASKKTDEGRQIIAAAEANAAFWDTLYQAAVTIRDLPGTVVEAVGTGAVSAGWAFIKRAWWVLALIGIGLLVWYGRGTIARMAVRKIAGGAA